MQAFLQSADHVCLQSSFIVTRSVWLRTVHRQYDALILLPGQEVLTKGVTFVTIEKHYIKVIPVRISSSAHSCMMALWPRLRSEARFYRLTLVSLTVQLE